MNRRTPSSPVARLPLALAALTAIAACSSDGGRAPTAPAFDRSAATPIAYNVSFRDDVSAVAVVAGEMARRGGFALQSLRTHAGRGFTAMIPPAFVATLQADPRVSIIEPDGWVTLRLPHEAAKPVQANGQQASWGLTRVGGSGDGTGKTAWIVDTGIDLNHPDLNTSRKCHANFVTTATTADDGNGHGTHVAGIIAAKNNNTGTLGIAANAWVCAVRVLNASGSGQWSWILNGVDYVAGKGAVGEVANMSLGGTGSNATLENAVQQASSEVKFAIAAGNDGADANDFTPARTNGANIYTVSAIDSNGCMPSWSNWGNPPVDYAAPGVSILSLYKGGGTKVLSGTSMAAPHVAGILLMGSIRSDGLASCDPDGNPDPIAHR